MYKVIGYYICELAEVPDCFGIKSKAMISVSRCLTTIYGGFWKLSDAKHFYQTYFAEANCILVSVSTTEEFYDLLMSELNEESVNHKGDSMAEKEDAGALLGYDILGWDMGGFHSFLCNGLQKELPSARLNDVTLLENDFSEVVEFARQIQGKGEPVEWVPCRIAAVK